LNTSGSHNAVKKEIIPLNRGADAAGKCHPRESTPNSQPVQSSLTPPRLIVLFCDIHYLICGCKTLSAVGRRQRQYSPPPSDGGRRAPRPYWARQIRHPRHELGIAASQARLISKRRLSSRPVLVCPPSSRHHWFISSLITTNSCNLSRLQSGINSRSSEMRNSRTFRLAGSALGMPITKLHVHRRLQQSSLEQCLGVIQHCRVEDFDFRLHVVLQTCSTQVRRRAEAGFS